MKKSVVLLLLLTLVKFTFAQQYALYNSRTLFDSFENPSQKAFQVDSSRKYAYNFFFPTVSVNGTYNGEAQNAFKSDFSSEKINTDDIILGRNQMNTFHLNSNIYLAMFRVFSNVKQNIEMGFSWQVRNDGEINVASETLAIFNNYNLFTDDQYNFKNSGSNQSYHQVSYTYREDYNKRLALGIKLSLLNGITFNGLKNSNTILNIDRGNDSISVLLNGTYRSNFKFSDMNQNLVLPKLKNLGFSFGLSSSYKLKNNWLILGNLKDIGFIKWDNKSSYIYKLKDTVQIKGTANGFGTRLNDRLNEIFINAESQAGFTSITNGKAEILINKNLRNYQPNLILSKNLFYKGGDIALINNFKVKNFVYTISTGYNLDNNIQVGAQAMFKTPNAELYIGSGQLLTTYNIASSILKNNFDDKNHSGVSFYFGLAFKFGPDMENQHNANTIPGMEDTNTNFSGFFRRIFSKK